MAKRSWVLLTILFLVLITLSTAYAAEPIVIRISHLLDTNSTWQAGCLKFGELVEKETGGRAIVKVYPNSQLGGEKESLEGLRMGTLEMTITSAGMLANFFPKVQVFDMPYLFRDAEHCRKVLGGPIGWEVAEEMRKACGIRILAWWDRGARNLTTTNRPVHSPSDLKGLKMRVPQVPLYIDLWKTLGANPTPMAWPEVFMALQQGVIEGQENPVEFIYSSSLYDVQKYLMLTEHIRIRVWLAYSDKLFNKLPKDIQDAILEAAAEAGEYHDKLVRDREEEYLAKLKEKGMQIIRVDQRPFAEAVKDLYKKYVQFFGEDLYQRIKNVQ